MTIIEKNLNTHSCRHVLLICTFCKIVYCKKCKNQWPVPYNEFHVKQQNDIEFGCLEHSS